jgi:hypothetical protein
MLEGKIAALIRNAKEQGREACIEITIGGNLSDFSKAYRFSDYSEECAQVREAVSSPSLYMVSTRNGRGHVKGEPVDRARILARGSVQHIQELRINDLCDWVIEIHKRLTKTVVEEAGDVRQVYLEGFIPYPYEVFEITLDIKKSIK